MAWAWPGGFVARLVSGLTGFGMDGADQESGDDWRAEGKKQIIGDEWTAMDFVVVCAVLAMPEI